MIESSLEPWAARAGHWLLARRRQVLLVWGALLLLGALAALRLPQVLFQGSLAIPGSASEGVEVLLRDRFASPYAKHGLVVLNVPNLTIEDPRLGSLLDRIPQALARVPGVWRVTGWRDRRDARFLSPDRATTLWMVGFKVSDSKAEQLLIPEVRRVLEPLRKELALAVPGSRLVLTGRATMLHDIDHHSARDAEIGELRALPLTAFILIVAFGALAAAGIPLVVALVGTLVALGLSWVAAQVFTLSAMLQNIVSMMGLAVGIDYSLLLVSRFREALVHHPPREAAVWTLSRTGPAIVVSALAVVVALSGLWLSPMVELRSIAVGGMLVVIVAALGSLTLVPVLLAMLGPNIDWPRRLVPPEGRAWVRRGWYRLTQGLLTRPWRTMLGAVSMLALLIWPLNDLRLGFGSTTWLPAAMESRQGIDLLEEMGPRNAMLPIQIVVEATDGKPALWVGHLPALHAWARALSRREGIADVLSPMHLRAGMSLAETMVMYRNPDKALERMPEIREAFVSRDGTAIWFQVLPARDLGLEGAQALSRALAREGPPVGFRVQVGGEPQYYNDFDDHMGRAFLRALLLVLGVTLLVLGLAFRSILVPVKAILMNLLAVGASYGVLVAVFQHGIGLSWLGMDEPLEAIPRTIPIIIFCITFGLSMDYEVFLLSRIREAWVVHGDNRRAVAEGLAATGGLITSAAAIMVVVFGCFAWAEVAIVKMIGLGLAVAVLLDATVIRVMLVPAFMTLAGRWNWWPGDRPVLRSMAQEVPHDPQRAR
ncbi:MAG: MMPL family transporter [Candidatus Sericytochromatia bacterium]|nr:MMPL family transporter [Candidatus Sericytochromatia bacterium]